MEAFHGGREEEGEEGRFLFWIANLFRGAALNFIADLLLAEEDRVGKWSELGPETETHTVRVGEKRGGVNSAQEEGKWGA